MLWDIIRDFIVEHITGGHNSLEEHFDCFIGYDYNADAGVLTSDFNVSIGNNVTIAFGDWLATTLTIIAMCLIVAFAIWLVRWVFKAVSSAFLLKR